MVDQVSDQPDIANHHQQNTRGGALMPELKFGEGLSLGAVQK